CVARAASPVSPGTACSCRGEWGLRLRYTVVVRTGLPWDDTSRRISLRDPCGNCSCGAFAKKISTADMAKQPARLESVEMIAEILGGVGVAGLATWAGLETMWPTLHAYGRSFIGLKRGSPYLALTYDDGITVEGMLIYPPGKFEAKHLPM